MKIFSAQDLEHQEFSLIEFRSELEALPLLNTLPNDVKLIDLFSLLNGHFVAFLSCKSLKKTFESLSSNPAVVDGYFTNDTNMESLQAFYYLNKVNLLDTLLVAETDKISKAFELLDLAHRSDVGVLDIKNQRTFKTNTLYFTGTLKNIMSFKEQLQKDKIQHQVLEKISENLVNALGGS